MQVVVFNLTGHFISGDTLTALAVSFYEEFGYDPTQTDAQGNNPTDQGGNMDQIAEFLINGGLAMLDGTRDRFAAAFEVDPRNEADLSFCARECLGIGFGIVVTDTVMPQDGSSPPAVWSSRPGERQLGGHFVYGHARLADGNWRFISWGLEYAFDPSFHRNVVQAIAYVSADALKDGRTVLGQDLAGWQAVMAGHGRPIAS